MSEQVKATKTETTMACPMCGGPYDPVAELQVMLDRETDFAKAHPWIGCPACHKRLSARSDSVDASTDAPTVRMVCHYCDHRFTLPRVVSPAIATFSDRADRRVG